MSDQKFLTKIEKRNYLFVVNLGSGKRSGESRGLFLKQVRDARSTATLHYYYKITKKNSLNNTQ